MRRCEIFFCLTALMAAAALAQQKPPVPRADGKPDLSGIWQGGIGLALSAEERKALTPPASGATPYNEPAPYQPAAAAKVQEFRQRRGIDDPDSRCLMPGVPRITGMPMPLQISQKPGQLIILYEAFHSFRVIPTNGGAHPDDIEPGYLGDSVGHWEGDTLAVDVVGLNDKTWLAGTGTFHSDALHVTERYTRADYDTLVYDVVMDDPKVFTQPWHSRSVLRLRPTEHLREYECIENNEDLLRYEKILEDDPLYKKGK